MKIITSLMLMSSLVALSVQAQMCNPNIQKTKPDSQYELMNTNTEVLDKKTGLIWQRCALGMSWNGNTCVGTATNYNWENALAQAATTASTTQIAWRLPNIKELKSLVETACYNQAINATIFPVTPAYLWSSSAYADSAYYAWFVNFNDGNGDRVNKNNGHAVRLVRSQ